MTTSGSPCDQPPANVGMRGRSASLPLGAPPSTHLAIVVDLRGAQAAVVLERAVARIGAPRRHLAARDLDADRFRPRPDILVRDQRHRRDFAGTMAARRSWCRGSARRPWKRWEAPRRPMRSVRDSRGPGGCASCARPFGRIIREIRAFVISRLAASTALASLFLTCLLARPAARQPPAAAPPARAPRCSRALQRLPQRRRSTRAVARGAARAIAAGDHRCAHRRIDEVPGLALSGDERRAIAESLTGRKLRAPLTGNTIGNCGRRPPLRDPGAGPLWNGWGPSIDNTHFQPAEQAQLTAEQVPRLRLKWAFGFPDATSAWAQPTIAGGRAVRRQPEWHGLFARCSERLCRLDLRRAGRRARVDLDRSAFARGLARASARHRQGTASGPSYFSDQKGFVYALDAATGRCCGRGRSTTIRSSG